MSLSQEPVFSLLKSDFVCGVKDITGKPYAGKSDRHDTKGKAVHTSNGSGPRNVQLFVLAPDGTVLHCLPGYWNSRDLAYELNFAKKVYGLYRNKKMAPFQKKDVFQQMQLAHIDKHPPKMANRSHMQRFDQTWEARHRLKTSDTIKDVDMILASKHGPPQEAFKTTDEIMHERMAMRPFMKFDRFDVARFVDYGRPSYDKQENTRDSRGRRIRGAFQHDELPRKLRRSSVIKDYSWGRTKED